MKVKKIAAVLCCLLAAVLVLPACTPQQETQEEMDRGEIDLTGEMINVTDTDDDAYTVTITDANLMKDEEFAERLPGVVTADEADVPSENAAGAKSEWDLGSVAREDVNVSYNVAASVEEGDEPAWTTASAEVTGFSNDNGTIALSFKKSSDDEMDISLYTVRFAGTEYYAVVQTIPEQSDAVIEEVDYDAQLAELEAYKPDFSEKEIALPEGTYIEEGDLIVTDEADELVQEVLVDSGFAEEEMSRADPITEGAGDGLGENPGVEAVEWQDDAPPAGAGGEIVENPGVEAVEWQDDAPQAGAAGNAGNAGGAAIANPDAESAAVQYMKEYNATVKKYQNFDAVANYAPAVLGYIHPTAGKVGEFGADVYRIFRGFYTNDWNSGIAGAMGVLKMFGLFKTPQGVSNAQILSEVQKVGLEVANLHELTKAMNATLDETLKQAYANNLQSFDNAMLSLHSNAEIIQRMFTEGAIRAEEDGIVAPGENCTAEEELDYNYDLVNYIENLEKTGGRKNVGFKDFSQYMEGLRNDFVLVAGEVAKQAEYNPIKAFDKYWDLYFNFESQGFYLRQSYRSDIEFELKRGFGLLEIYYNIFDTYDLGNHMEHNTQLFAALDRLEQLGAGVSPEEVKKHTPDKQGFAGMKLYSPTFQRNITKIVCAPGTAGIRGPSVPINTIEKYISKLHGRDIKSDFTLAGLCYNGFRQYNDGFYFDYRLYKFSGWYWYDMCSHGLGFNPQLSKGWYLIDIVDLDGKALHRGTKVTYKDREKEFTPYDNSEFWYARGMPYIYFIFE